MKYVCFLIITLFFFSCEKKTENFKPTQKLDLILKNDKLNKAYSDFRMENAYLLSKLENQENFINFINTANTNDLLLLTECEIPIVRCFAFKGLAVKNYPKIREILLRHENDNQKIVYFAGRCIKMELPVKIYMLDQLGPFSSSNYSFNKVDYNKIRTDFLKDLEK